MKHKKVILVLILIIIGLYYVNEQRVNTQGETIPEQEGTIEVYFCPRENCTQVFIQEIREYEEIKCAFYDLTLEELANEIKSKNYDMVVDDDNYEKAIKLIETTHDDRSGLMHNKFCVMQNKLITGSFNPTYRGSNKNNNNLIVIESNALIQNYEEEFQEMKNQEFPGEKTRETKFNIGGILIENYFCPEDNCEEQVLEALSKTNKSIEFMTFSFTSDEIGDLILAKHLQGIKIKGVFEKRLATNQYSEYNYLKKNNVEVKFDGNGFSMHHKVFLIDNETVITGSYNPTRSGNKKNDENILIIHNKEIAKQFEEEFKLVWREAE